LDEISIIYCEKYKFYQYYIVDNDL